MLSVNGLVEGNIYRKPWLLPSNIGGFLYAVLFLIIELYDSRGNHFSQLLPPFPISEGQVRIMEGKIKKNKPNLNDGNLYIVVCVYLSIYNIVIYIYM